MYRFKIAFENAKIALLFIKLKSIFDKVVCEVLGAEIGWERMELVGIFL